MLISNYSLYLLKNITYMSTRQIASNNVPLLNGKKLKVITVDALNTIIRLDQSPGDTYADFARQINCKCNGDELNNAFRKNFKKLSKTKLCYGFRKDGVEAWWIELVKNCFADVGKEGPQIDNLARDLYKYYGSRKPWRLVDEQIHNHLRDLQKKGIRLGVISNFDSRLRVIFSTLNLSSFFEVMFLSGEIGVEKPNRQIFIKAAKYFEITDMEEMLHIGDDEEKDFNGARNAGARAVLINPGKAFCGNNEYVISSFRDLINRFENS